MCTQLTREKYQMKLRIHKIIIHENSNMWDNNISGLPVTLVLVHGVGAWCMRLSHISLVSAPSRGTGTKWTAGHQWGGRGRTNESIQKSVLSYGNANGNVNEYARASRRASDTARRIDSGGCSFCYLHDGSVRIKPSRSTSEILNRC